MPGDRDPEQEKVNDAYFGSYAYLFRPQVLNNRQKSPLGEAVYVDPPGMKYIRYVLMACLALFVAVVLFPRFPQTLKVSGAIVPVEPTIKVVAPRQGVIRRVSVTEGGDLREGSMIANVVSDTGSTPTQALSDLSYLQEMLSAKAKNKEEARVVKDNDISEIKAQISQNAQEIGNVEKQVLLLDSTIEDRKNSLVQLETLVRKGSVSKVDYFERKNRLTDDRRQRLSLTSEIDKLLMTNKRLNKQIEKVENQFRLQDREAEAELLELKLRIQEARKKASDTIFSPTDGRVLSLNVAEGQWVVQNQLVATVGKPDTRYRADLYLDSRSIGEVAPGQHVVIKLQAYPYRTFGTVAGKILTVSATSFAPGELETYSPRSAPFFLAEVELGNSARFTLKPGMLLDAEIILQERSILQSILLSHRGSKS